MPVSETLVRLSPIASTTVTRSLLLPAEPSAAPLARSFIRENTVLDSMRHTEADLLITEMICNVVQHTSLIDSVELKVDASNPRTVRIALEHDLPEPLRDPEPGVGFTLLDRISQNWGHGHDGARLEIWFTLRKPGSMAGYDHLCDDQLLKVMSLDPSECSDVLIRRHRDLAVAISRRYRGKGVSDEDLEQVALMGLLKAIHRYDASKGELRPYAAVTISGELKRWLRDKGWSVRVPRSVQESALLTARASDHLAQRLSREPTADEVAEHLGLTEDEILEAACARRAYSSRSIDKGNAESGRTPLDTLEDQACLLKEAEDRLMLEDAISQLPDRQRMIMDLRFNEDMSQSEIARIAGISQVHVSRLLSDALSRLAKTLAAQRAEET